MEASLIKTGQAIEAVEAMLDALKELPGTDARSLAVARTHFETAFLWAANAAGGEAVFS
jgi:hypothetical protein